MPKKVVGAAARFLFRQPRKVPQWQLGLRDDFPLQIVASAGKNIACDINIQRKTIARSYTEVQQELWQPLPGCLCLNDAVVVGRTG